MSILIDKNSRVMVQGITGGEGSFHTRQCLDYGTNIVAGMTPGRGGQKVESVPVFNTVEQAVRETGADVSIIFVPAAFAADSIMESADAGVPLVICITEGIPTVDMMTVKRFLQGRTTRVIGPNCPGVISPGKSKVGIMPGHVFKEGRVGVVSRSGTLTYEAAAQLTSRGIGQSTCVGLGGDPIIGTAFIEALKLFQADPDTDAVVVIGEIGGVAEQEAATYIKQEMTKPVVAFIAGATAPPGRRMGHAGAIIAGASGTAQDKMRALQEAGATISRSPAEIGATLKQVVESRR